MSYSFNKDAKDGDKVTLDNGVEYIFHENKLRWVVNSVEDALGEELVKKSGDTMTGTLEMVKTDDVDPKIETRFVSSGENSNLQIQHNGNTRIYVGNDQTSFNKPVQLNTEGDEQSHAVTKGYIDAADAHLQVKIDELEQEIDVIAPRLDAAQYSYSDSAAVRAGQMHIVSGTFTGSSDVIVFNDEALDGNVHTWADVDVGEYIEVTDTKEADSRTADNYAMYLVTKAPEGTGMKQIEVSIVKGQGAPVVGDVMDVKAFQLGSNDINELDDRYLVNGGSTTLKGPTQLLSTSSKYLNIQAAPGQTSGFFVMRDNNSRNILHVSNNGEIKLKEGRMATDIDEITTKRYVDSKLSSGGGGGSSVIGRRFKYNTSGDYSTKGYFCYGSGKLKLATEDMDGGKMIHSTNYSYNGVNEITWSSNLKFTIRDSSGYMVVMGEAGANTDYASGGLRFRIPDSVQGDGSGPRYGHFTKLQGGQYYQITVEGYF